MTIEVSVTVAPSIDGLTRLVAPTGLATAHQMPVSFRVDGGRLELAGETATGQMIAVVTPGEKAPVTLTYLFEDGGCGYPEAMFIPRQNRFTKAAENLVAEARDIAANNPTGSAAIEAIVNSVAEKFVYGHPETRFNDGLDEVPYISCGTTQGSCVDINTYLIACLRSAGFEAGYVYGYFFPEEKNGTCEDGHCWVVTRHDGVVREWDIAHHLKLGKEQICSGLNPKPGHRVATVHSMGLTVPMLGISETKIIGEPGWVTQDGKLVPADLTISCKSDAAAAAA